VASMNEATKTNRIRGEEFKLRYLSGRVIDIGCGKDLVVPGAIPFDLPKAMPNGYSMISSPSRSTVSIVAIALST